MNVFGLVGKTLKHSFSRQYFICKFEKEAIENSMYELFELARIDTFPVLLKRYKTTLKGLNVTAPYKKEIIPYLDELDETAQSIQAVNTIAISSDGKLKGYNTDYIGFKNSLIERNLVSKKALILGTGGASNAVKKVLEDLNIPFQMVSRVGSDKALSYQQLTEDYTLTAYHLIINTTPLGTFPNVKNKPVLPYHLLTSSHLLFDLVYNPTITAFMKEGSKAGAQVQNGYDMLVGQAEAAWTIWNK